MLPRDIFARSIEHPKDFPDHVLDHEQVFQFSETLEKNGKHALSVASKWLLRTTEAIHDYGRTIVEIKNDRYRETKGMDPDPLRKYVGSFYLFAKSIEGLELEKYKSELKWKPEAGQDAHFQIELTPHQIATAKELKKERRQVRQGLFDARFGPDICDIAKNDLSLRETINNLKYIPKPI